MAGRLTVKAINNELARRGYKARLEKTSGYFYFWTGDAAEWLERTVRVQNVNDLTLEDWLNEFRRLKNLNQQIMKTGPVGRGAKSKSRVRS
jgi:hypothetical protein